MIPHVTTTEVPVYDLQLCINVTASDVHYNQWYIHVNTSGAYDNQTQKECVSDNMVTIQYVI